MGHFSFELVFIFLSILLPQQPIAAIELIEKLHCGKHTRCFLTSGCDPNANSDVGATYKKMSDQILQVELITKGYDTYGAIGFSKDRCMGNDYVIYCTPTGIFSGYNPSGHSPTRVFEDAMIKKSVTLVEHEQNDGYLVCRFNLSIYIPQVEDLADWYTLNQNLYLFMATGKSPRPGAITHRLSKFVKPLTVNLFAPLEPHEFDIWRKHQLPESETPACTNDHDQDHGVKDHDQSDQKNANKDDEQNQAHKYDYQIANNCEVKQAYGAGMLYSGILVLAKLSYLL